MFCQITAQSSYSVENLLYFMTIYDFFEFLVQKYLEVSDFSLPLQQK